MGKFSGEMNPTWWDLFFSKKYPNIFLNSSVMSGGVVCTTCKF